MTDANNNQIILDSKLVGCMIRDLPFSVLNEDTNKFKYINCLDRKYTKNPKNIKCVNFPISRFDKYKHLIKFPNLVSEKEAIEEVEKYLSEPLTKKYYNNIVNDLFHKMPWREAKKNFKVRGDCLTDE